MRIIAPLDLLVQIETRQATVSVIGLGYVGLPLAVTFAEAGFSVVGIEIDEEKVRAVQRRESYIDDVSSERLAALAGGRITATSDFSSLAHADVAIVCVPTPLGKTRDPDLSNIIAAADEIARWLHHGMLVVLESTTYPGTTEEVILPRLSSSNGQSLEVGEDFFLAFSPERIDPGRSDWTVEKTPKVMGGVTPRCLRVARKLYEAAIAQVVPVSSPRVAEMVKLLENTFRATNIALVNEIAIICNRLGVDVWEVIDAAKTKPFGFMPFYPGPGLGGHCIPIDPQYLAWKLRTLNYNARFIQLAQEINLGMPGFVLTLISDALNDAGRPLKGSRVLVLGVAYKSDVADIRESPALDLIELLIEKGAAVSYHDPFVPDFDVDGLSLSSVHLDEAALKASDCVVITTAHSAYDWPWIVANSPLIVDTRNATRGVDADPSHVVKI